MPFTRPTLPELQDSAQTDVSTSLGGGPLLTRGIAWILSRALAGAVHGLYGFLNWISLQLFPDTADAANLERLGSLFGVKRRAATYGQGLVDFTGNEDSEIPEGTRVRRTDGTLYETDALATIAGGAAQVLAVAVEPGALSSTDAGSTLSLVSPLSGIVGTLTVAAGGIAGGEDVETDALYRDRVLARLRSAPRGGAAADYKAWALEVPGVTRAWVLSNHLGLGTVGVAFMRDDDLVDAFPDTAEVAEVQTYLEDRRPVTSDVTAFAPVALPINVEIQLVPDTTELRAAVVQAITDLIERDGEPGGAILVSRIHEAISTTPGESDHTLVAPAANVALSASEIATLGTVTWS